MTNCCRKCAKLMCRNRNKIEDCTECISYVLLELRKLNKIVEEDNDRFWKNQINWSRSL